MKYEINGHTVEVEKELTEAEIDEIAGQLGSSSTEAAQPGVVDKLKGLASKAAPALGEAADLVTNPVGAIMSRVPEMAQRASNFVQGRPNQPAQTILQAAANRPDVTAAAGASVLPGVGIGPAVARVAGQVGAASLDPNASVFDQAGAGALQGLFEAIPYGMGKVAPGARKILARLSQTDADGLKKLFDNPTLFFTGPSKDQARAAYAAAAEKAGITPEMSDEVLFGSGKKFVQKVTDALSHSEDVPTQSLLDARQTVDDLIATAKRLGKKNKVRGLMQRREQIDSQIVAQEAGLKEADQVWSQMKTRDQFLNVIPRNRQGEMSVNVPSIVATLLGGPVGMAASSPVVQGVAASSLGALSRTAPIGRSALQTIRQYLTGQMNAPGSPLQ